MYTTYETKQWCMITPYYLTGPYTRPPRRIPNLSKTNDDDDFMPTWLVRISDMQLVRGSTVNEGYCALSYSWNQSGESIVDEVTGKSERVDEGRHKIIYPGKNVPKKPRGRKKTPRKINYVKFEALIQQICKDFNIKYIWFDQLCINQGDKNDKHREIKRMHQIYSRAYCTVVLLPEFYVRATSNNYSDAMSTHYDISNSEWLTRLWTLEEALLSQRLLFLGRNVHLWWYAARAHLDISPFCNGRQLAETKVSTILKYAHQRTSTNSHDRVFALSHIFPEIIHSMGDATYDHPLMDLIIEFYGLLAKRDLSILCFGDASHLDLERPIQLFDIPSWTGVHGKHIIEFIENGKLYPSTTFQNYKMVGKFMQVTCTAISTIDPSQQQIRKATLPHDSQLPSRPRNRAATDDSDNTFEHWTLTASVRLLGHKSSKRVVLDDIYSFDADDDAMSFSEHLDTVSYFMPVEKKNLFWTDDSTRQEKEKSTDFTFDLTESIDTSLVYFILSGIQFDLGIPNSTSCPVIKREGETFKAIGLCHIENYNYFFSDYVVPEMTFIIE
ncbi:heterokaryon incompatibility protein-domain-containing protein [Phascolomyces articulosus]|uniref:Heterokaryon incompatibility protein-domain-containing protein n=1 Tax=Phascolomyces articulosus TaxID=60185 RepID=A0AAD5PJN2_9FUNG|nr:heterokaryon incompatibility protein-domain-containing protein [Phascolomyces articulosus]